LSGMHILRIRYVRVILGATSTALGRCLRAYASCAYTPFGVFQNSCIVDLNGYESEKLEQRKRTCDNEAT
jgi:hypothetical protein